MEELYSFGTHIKLSLVQFSKTDDKEFSGSGLDNPWYDIDNKPSHDLKASSILSTLSGMIMMSNYHNHRNYSVELY